MNNHGQTHEILREFTPGLTDAANSFLENLLQAVFRAISNYFAEVEQLEKTVGQDAFVAEAQCIFQLGRKKARNVDYV